MVNNKRFRNEQIRINIILYISMIIASILGGYAQDITYIINENTQLSLIFTLILITILSLILFISPVIILIILNQKRKLNIKNFIVYLIINGFLGIAISGFSLLVLIFWAS